MSVVIADSQPCIKSIFLTHQSPLDMLVLHITQISLATNRAEAVNNISRILWEESKIGYEHHWLLHFIKSPVG